MILMKRITRSVITGAEGLNSISNFSGTMKDPCTQIRIITKVIAATCLTSMLLCYKLWLNERNFPLVPVYNFHLPSSVAFPLFISSILLLVCILSFRFPQKFIIAFLVTAALLVLLDQNRWQPWFYQYAMM